MKKVQLLPHLVTIGNLVSGFCSICIAASFLHLSKNQNIDPNALLTNNSLTKLLHISFGLIFVGMIFDAFDGKVARLTNSISEFGAELDSLADAITFGVAPAVLSAIMLLITDPDAEKFKMIYLIPSLFTLCSVLRLARYNVERNEPGKDSNYFKGLPTPAGAAAIVSLLWLQLESSIFPVAQFRWLILAMCVIIGYLEVSNFKYLHLGQKLLKEPKSIHFIVVFVLVVYLLLNFAVYSLFIISYGYILINTLISFFGLIKQKKLHTAFEEDPDDVV